MCLTRSGAAYLIASINAVQQSVTAELRWNAGGRGVAHPSGARRRARGGAVCPAAFVASVRTVLVSVAHPCPWNAHRRVGTLELRRQTGRRVRRVRT